MFRYFMVFMVVLVITGCPPPSDRPPEQCEVDGEDLCPYTCRIRGEANILLDSSDTISFVTRNDIRNRIAEHLDSSPLTKMRVYAVRDLGKDEEIKPRLEMCIPVNPDDTRRPDVYRRNWIEYKKRIEVVFDSVFREGDDTASPILEAVQAATVQAASNGRVPPVDSGFRRDLIFVSDMIQNSESVSFLHNPPEFDNVPIYLGSDLAGFETTVYLLYRPDFTSIQQSDKFSAFWENYGKSMNVRSWTLDPLIGGS